MSSETLFADCPIPIADAREVRVRVEKGAYALAHEYLGVGDDEADRS